MDFKHSFSLTPHPTVGIRCKLTVGNYLTKEGYNAQSLLDEFSILTYLQRPGTAVTTWDDFEKNEKCWTFILPITLVDFLIEKYENDPKANIALIKRWTTQGRPNQNVLPEVYE